VYVNPKEAQMNSARRLFAALAVVLALCVAPAAQATVDYSMNAAGGDYAPAVTPQADTAAASTDTDFAWGAAALGAGAALAVVLLVTATRTRISTARSHREAA
jgi:hypothetical protein